jgi:phospholipase C
VTRLLSSVIALASAGVLAAACGAGDASAEADDSAFSAGGGIEHVVVIVQENHTFDAYYGRYCKAPAGSNPTCTTGPDCCEAAPDSVDGHSTGHAMSPMSLTDATNTIDPHGLDRNHDSVCEYLEMDCAGVKDDGSPDLGETGADDPKASCKMDRYIDATLGTVAGLVSKAGGGGAEAGGSNCGSNLGIGLSLTASNWAIADPESEVPLYRDYAKQGAIGDRYFQPVVGQTSSNDMFLATAQFEFRDNTWFPKVAGSACQAAALPADHQPNFHTIKDRQTIADLLLDKLGADGFGYYHLGFRDMTDPKTAKDAKGCPTALPALCPSIIAGLKVPANLPNPKVACMNDPSDNPFRYFEQFGDGGKRVSSLHDYDDFAKDIAAGKLPAVSYIKAVTAVDEHPAFGPLSTGQTFVKQTVDAVLNSDKYKDNTLVLVTWDEGGGFYDHIAPPAVFDPHGAVDPTGLHTNSEVAGPGWMRVGTRIPIIALGKFARKNEVSHVAMEHSSIVKFLEWNFLDHVTGQLKGRESQVNNLGSLLDPTLGVPEKDAVPHQR